MFTIGSCFSGIGGFELGLEMAGFKTLWQIEYDDSCQKILKKHWPDVKKYKDINNVKIKELETPGIITGGYPCQPFSLAGNRQGEKDDRHLWPKMFEIIKAKRPNWIVCENVLGHVSMGLDAVLSDLGSISYSYQTFIIPTCAVGSPQLRERVWIVAHSRKSSDNIKRTFHKNKNILAKKSKNRVNIWSEYNRICKFDEWLPEQDVRSGSAFCRKINGVSPKLDKSRIEALGNAIDPRLAYQIGRAIIKTEQHMENNTI